MSFEDYYYLCLVDEVSDELQSLLGLYNATYITEPLIQLGWHCESYEEFHARLKERGVKIPGSVLITVWEAIRRAVPPRIESDEPELNRVYKGKVYSVSEYGIFVKLDGFSTTVEGFVVASDGENVKVRTGQEIFVKVVSNSEKFKILSMKGVDQRTGEDSGPSGTKGSMERTCLSGIKIGEEIEIELNEEIPAFLEGKRDYLVDNGASPVKIFMDPSCASSVWSSLFNQHRKDRTRDNSSGSIPGEVTTGPISLSIKERRESLPIYRFKDEIIRAVNESQVVIVVGETGSGKTTQLTQYLAGAGHGKIACSQPWGAAAKSAAKRVAEELSCRVGETVGYTTLFESRSGLGTVINYTTDTEFLGEITADDDKLFSYSSVILDEAHERTAATDILFVLMRTALERRPDLRLVIATSTADDVDKLSGFFSGKCRVVEVPGRRAFPVEIVYEKRHVVSYLDSALSKVLEIHRAEPQGDIIIFLAIEDEEDISRQILRDRTESSGPALVTFSLENRKVIVVHDSYPEASLEKIDGVAYVVDPGFEKIKVRDPKQALSFHVVAPISQSSARERARLAGVSGPGKCYRLYTETAFLDEMSPNSAPEIQRGNIDDTVLRMKAKVKGCDVSSFKFMDRPSPIVLTSALRRLYCLGALDEDGLVTELGRNMAELPLEPPYSRMLLAGAELGCGGEVLTVISMLMAGNVFCRTMEKLAEADRKRVWFLNRGGDHLNLVALYEAWKAQSYSIRWCSENFVRAVSLERALFYRKHLSNLMVWLKLEIVSAGEDSMKIRKAITAGLFFHAAKKDQRSDGYRTLVGDQTVHIHPSSSLHQRQPSWVVYNELFVDTKGKKYMHNVTCIDPSWLVELAPRFFRVADPSKTSL